MQSWSEFLTPVWIDVEGETQKSQLKNFENKVLLCKGKLRLLGKILDDGNPERALRGFLCPDTLAALPRSAGAIPDYRGENPMQQIYPVKPGAVFFLILGMMTICAPASADKMSQIQTTKRITIAYRESSLPFSYLDQGGRPVGYSVDLCLKAAEAVQKALKLPRLEIAYIPVTSATRIPAIVDGKADLECGSTTNNVGRRKQVSFTVSHFVATVRMLVRKDSGITTWKDLRGKTVVTTKATTPVQLVMDLNASSVLALNLKLGQDHKDSFSILEQGKADAFVMDDVLLYGLRASARHPEYFVVRGSALSAEPYAIMMTKEDAAFKKIIDMEISRLALSGELGAIYKKWFTAPIAPNNINLQMPMSGLLRDMLKYPSDKVGD